MHVWELLVIMSIGWGSLLFANYNTSYEIYQRENMTEVTKYLFAAEKTGKPGQTNLISTRNIDSSVNNTFAAGYCTYGAARISPEFFPYSGSTEQVRTRWGNAIDRCENAKAAGFDIGANARVGALIIYNPGNRISALGHVGKVMYYNNKTSYMIIRDMNRVWRNIMSDHWDTTSTANIKCFIYPKTQITTPVETINTNTGTSTTIGNTETNNTVTPILANTTTTTNTGTTTNPVTPTEQNSNTSNTNNSEQSHESATQEPVQEPIQQEPTQQDYTTVSDINLDLDSISDISKHFMDQYTFTIKKISTINSKVGDTITLVMNAKEKTTNASYQGILPFLVTILNSNTKTSTDISRIQLLQDSNMEIHIKAIEAGDSTVVILLDDQTIAKIAIHITN